MINDKEQDRYTKNLIKEMFEGPVHHSGSRYGGHKGQQAKAQARRRRSNQIARMSRRVNRRAA